MKEMHEKYTLIEKLGGQINRKFGSVYLVQNKVTNEFGVLKSLAKNDSNTHFQERFRTEAEINYQFNGLPESLDFYESDEEIILINKYIPGITLDKYWHTISPKDRIPILKLILHGLAPILNHLKQKQIVHCDIKPSNIIIEEKNDILFISLIDFGLAIDLKLENDRSILFPLGYAAPELLLNHLKIVDHRTDLFSIGIVIWKLLCGKLPLTHPNPSVFTNLQITHPLPDSSDLPKGWHTLLEKLCFKHTFRTVPNLLSKQEVETCLQKAISKRYNNLDEFIQEIEQLPKQKRWLFF